MTADRVNQKLEIEFGPDGKCYAREPKTAEFLLRLANPENEIEIVIDASPIPIPLLQTWCDLPQPPVNGKICPNDSGICPMDVRLRFSPEVVDEWEAAQGDD